MILTNKVEYKLNIDYAGEYKKEERYYPILSLRLYIDKDCTDIEKPIGVNINSEATDDYDYAVDSIACKIDRWFNKKLEEEVDSKSWLNENEKARHEFNKLSKCSATAVKSLMTKVIVD